MSGEIDEKSLKILNLFETNKEKPYCNHKT